MMLAIHIKGSQFYHPFIFRSIFLPFNIPVINDGGSEGLLRMLMYGKLPMIGNLGGPGGKRLGFLVLL